MNRIILILLSVLAVLVAGCAKSRDSEDLLTVDDHEIYEDTERYVRVGLMTMGYFDYDIYEVAILPPKKNSLASAIGAPSLWPSQRVDKWGDIGSGNNSLIWDKKWATPRQFKVWWFRVVDPVVFKDNKNYDPYITRETHPGGAWCEATIIVNNPPPIDVGYLILHFYPDGHLESYISSAKEKEAEKMRFTMADRNKLPVLQGKPCFKEIPNPYYGLKKPIPQY